MPKLPSRAAWFLALGLIAPSLPAQTPGDAAAVPPADTVPEVIDPARRPVFSPPGQPGIQARWVVGADGQPGLYALRVDLAAGTRIPPHTHPDERLTTVLEGTLWIAFGARMAPADAVPVPAGATVRVPGGVTHWVWAREGAVRYQEHGSGPTATRFLPADGHGAHPLPPAAAPTAPPAAAAPNVR